jgi:hypothetical protein
VNELTEEDLRRRKDQNQRIQRESGDPSRHDEVAALRREIDELKAHRDARYGTGGLTVNGDVWSVEEQRKPAGAQSAPLKLWRGGVLVSRRFLTAGGDSTTL